MFDILSNFAEFDDERLNEYLADVRAAFQAIADMEDPTDAQLDEAEALADHIDAILAVQNTRTEAATARADRAAALRNRFAEETAEEEAEEEETEDEPVEGEVVEVVDEEPEAQVASTAVAARQSRTAVIARKVERPVKPSVQRGPVTITAAADVPEFATGSELNGLVAAGQAVINRTRGFPIPKGDGKSEDLRYYGAASMRLDFPEDLQINHGTADDMEVLYNAIDQSRLPDGSLVAAGGWCAPSETLYDLCAGETVEGIASVPEVQINRGGIRFTSGPDFSALYAADSGFCQTEAEAIAGEEKPCFTIPCPPFTEVRMDVCGLCLRVPILTSVGYPELIQRWMSGSMIAHQHRMNANTIARMVALSGTALAPDGLGSTVVDTSAGLAIVADGIRQKFRLGVSSSMEALVPMWVRGAIKADLAARNGCCAADISDQQVNSVFANAGLNVQFVYDWQELPANATEYPATYQALIYPAGTFVKGVSDVINLSAVYDAASLATNVFTGLFYEEGILVAQLCYDSALVTLPICNAGRTGAADLTCATTP